MECKYSVLLPLFKGESEPMQWLLTYSSKATGTMNAMKCVSEGSGRKEKLVICSLDLAWVRTPNAIFAVRLITWELGTEILYFAFEHLQKMFCRVSSLHSFKQAVIHGSNQTWVKYTRKISIKLQLLKQFVNHNYNNYNEKALRGDTNTACWL